MGMFSKLFRSSATPDLSVADVLKGDARFTPEFIGHARSVYEQVLTGKRQASSLPPQLRDLNDKMIRSFESAVTNKYNADFRGTYGSANAEILVSDYTTRARSRTLCQNEPHGKGMLRTTAINVVGHNPFKLKVRVGKLVDRDNPTPGGIKKKFKPEKETNSVIESEWDKFGLPENFTTSGHMTRMEALMICEKSAFRDGRILVWHRRAFPHNDYNYAVTLLECDHLDQNYMGKAPITGNPIRFSIEFDQTYTDRPVAVWLLTRHPGDPFGAPADKANNWRKRYPIEDIIIFNNIRDRAEQDIGMTEMDSVIQYMWRVKQYETSLALAAIASCCKPYWIEKLFPTGMTWTSEQTVEFMSLLSQITGPMGTNGNGTNSGAVARQQQIGQRSDINAPASTMEMPYGEKLNQLDPKFPIEAAVGFRKNNLESVGAGIGHSYPEVANDFANMGFSAARAFSEPQRANWKVRQENLKYIVVRRIFKEWLTSSIMAGVFDKEGVSISISRVDEIMDAIKFQGVRWEFVNPLQDVQATILQLEAGILSRQQVQDELPDGLSVEDLYELMEEDKMEQEAHNLNFDAEDVTRPTVSKGEPGQVVPAPDASAQPPSKTKTTNPVRRRGMSETTARLIAMEGDGRNGYHD